MSLPVQPSAVHNASTPTALAPTSGNEGEQYKMATYGAPQLPRPGDSSSHRSCGSKVASAIKDFFTDGNVATIGVAGLGKGITHLVVDAIRNHGDAMLGNTPLPSTHEDTIKAGRNALIVGAVLTIPWAVTKAMSWCTGRREAAVSTAVERAV